MRPQEISGEHRGPGMRDHKGQLSGAVMSYHFKFRHFFLVLSLSLASLTGVSAAGEEPRIAADTQKTPEIQEGTYVIKVGKKLLGADVYFDLRNGGDTIDLPRGELTIRKNDGGYHVAGCFSMYRGAEVLVNRQCALREGAIYCRTAPDWAEVAPGDDNLEHVAEVMEVFIVPQDPETMKVKIVDASFSAGGSVENFNTSPYKLVKNRGSKCRFDR